MLSADLGFMAIGIATTDICTLTSTLNEGGRGGANMLFQDGRYFHSSREPENRVIDNVPNALADTCASGRSVLCKGRLYQTPPSRVYPPQLRSVPVVNGTALDGQGAGEPPVFVFVAVALLKANGEHK